MRGETQRLRSIKRVRKHDGSCLTIENENTVRLAHLERWIKRFGQHDVCVDIALTKQTATDHTALLRPDCPIQILAIRNAATVIEANRIRQRAVDSIAADVDIANDRHAVYRYFQRTKRRSKLTVLRHQREAG